MATYGVTWLTENTPRSMNPGATATVTISFQNTGTLTWPAGGNNPVRLGYHWRDGHGNVVVWNGARTPLLLDVPPLGVAALTATLQAPATGGNLTLQWDLVEEGITWFEAQGVVPPSIPVSVV